MEVNFGSKDVYDFLKLLIEIGGVHYIDESGCIYRTDDRTPVGVKLGSGKNDKKMIALFRENERPPQNAVYLNPFVELIGKHPELDLFMTITAIVPGCLALHTMIKMAELLRSKKQDAEFKTADLLSKYADKIDDKFINELQKIRPIDAGAIAYDTTKYTAQLQCLFWTDEWLEKMKSKLRKSTIKTVQEMITDIYGTDTPHSIMHQGTLPPCKRFDAVVHVLVETLSRMQKYVEPLTGMELHVDELKTHLERLPAYHKAMQWLATTTASSDKVNQTGINQIVANKDAPPWGSTVSAPKFSPVSDTGTGFLSKASAVGVTKNPTYGGGVTKNPTFGMGAMGGIFGAAPVTPSVPGLGGVSPVVPMVSGMDIGNVAANTFNSMNLGAGFSAFG